MGHVACIGEIRKNAKVDWKTSTEEIAWKT
jgi:hypothetical protein